MKIIFNTESFRTKSVKETHLELSCFDFPKQKQLCVLLYLFFYYLTIKSTESAAPRAEKQNLKHQGCDEMLHVTQRDNCFGIIGQVWELKFSTGRMAIFLQQENPSLRRQITEEQTHWHTEAEISATAAFEQSSQQMSLLSTWMGLGSMAGDQIRLITCNVCAIIP